MGVVEAAVAASLRWKVTASATFGLATHLLSFIRGEWHMKAPLLINLHILGALLCFWVERASGKGYSDAAKDVLYMGLAYFTALFTSLTVYRLYFHRLSRFPGPKMAAVSKWWHVLRCLDAKNHTFLHDMYEQYGEFVRTGPEELTVTHPKIHQLADAHTSSCYKAEWYDITRPNYSVMTTRSKKEHGERRRVWDHGFHKKSLQDYESRATEYVDQLDSKVEIAATQHQSIDITKLLYFFGWDVMGDITFGSSFDMLKNEEWHEAIIMLKKAMRFLGLISPMPWLARVAFAYLRHVWIVKDWFDFIEFCRQRLRDRSGLKVDKEDVASWLFKNTNQLGTLAADDEWVIGDTVLAIIAGSDTVTATLVSLFYRLAEDPSRAEKLYSEIRDLAPHDLKGLEASPYLEALIQETLRLHHPLPTGGPRKTGPEGLWVEGSYIPGNITIIGPRYSLGRHKDAFRNPDDFIPERWTTRKDLVKDPAQFIPFGAGRHVCTGKNLAWSEMRLVAGLLVQKYKFGFAEGETGRNVFEGMLDHVTPTLGPLQLCFEHRGS